MTSTFRDGQLLRAADLNNAFTEVKQESVSQITSHENEIYVGGTWYKRSGTFDVPSNRLTPTPSHTLYGSSATFESLNIPTGYTVMYSVIDAGNGYAFCMTSAQNPKKMWYMTTANSPIKKIAWTLIKNS